MFLLNLLIISIALAGHIAIGCFVFNQVHATSWSREIRKTSEKFIYALVFLLAIWLVWFWFSARPEGLLANVFLGYMFVCCCVFVAVITQWVYRKVQHRKPESVISERRHLVDLMPHLTTTPYRGKQANLLRWVPGNQSLRLSIEHRVFELPRWPQGLDGLVIAHLSDLHLTGKITKEYFEHVVRHCNECGPDVICLTGDIIDNVNCIPWLPELLGPLQARFGKFYCLGNHDKRARDEANLRSVIESTGFKRAGNRWQEVEIRHNSFYLAGNELPWFEGAESLPDGVELFPKVVLSHSPDQYFWAQSKAVDLMLAGHTHGGQIRLPFIGPIVTSSRHGVRFASGTFVNNGTIMHVSRGLSADDPIRWNCPPELAIIKVNRKTS